MLHGIKFTTLNHVPHNSKPIHDKSLEKIFTLCSKYGFTVIAELIDREF